VDLVRLKPVLGLRLPFSAVDTVGWVIYLTRKTRPWYDQAIVFSGTFNRAQSARCWSTATG